MSLKGGGGVILVQGILEGFRFKSGDFFFRHHKSGVPPWVSATKRGFCFFRNNS